MEEVSTPMSPKKRMKPRKLKLLEESIIAKSQKAIKPPKPSKTKITKTDDNVDVDKDSTKGKGKKRGADPVVIDGESGPGAGKRRKPRHATEEGQKFLIAKEKLRQEEEGTSLFSSLRKSKSLKSTPAKSTEEEPPKKKGKKKKKKGKKKNTGEGQTPKGAVNPKGSDSEDRPRRESLAYLQLWKKHRDHWKFEKLKQLWLLKHALFPLAIEDDKFTLLLEYIDSIKGAGRDKTLEEMEAFMSGFERKFGKSEENSVFNETSKDKEKPTDQDKQEYDRARQIVQILAKE